MSERNGHTTNRYGGLPDPFTMNAVQEMVRNSMLARSQFLDRFLDGRRDIDSECNYPSGEFLPIDTYRALYAREAVAERVCQVWPKESWQVQPNVYEDEDEETTTKFEQAFENLGKALLASNNQSYYESEVGSPGGNPIWPYLERADILSGIGTFGVILLGIDDGKLLEQPVDGVSPDGNPNLTKTGSSGPQATQVTNPSQAGPNVPGPNSDADKQLQPADLLSKDIYGGMTQEQKLSSTMGTDAQYFGTQFTPTSYHGGDPLSPMKGGGYYPKDNPEYPPSDEFAPGSPGPAKRKLLFLRVFDESLVQVVQYEADIRNPRFGQPLMYLITLNDPNQPHTGVGLPLASVRVHWSRVIHLADNLRNSEIFGVPRMLPVLNRLLDLRKLYGGSAEGYWKGALPIISLETNPQLGGDVIIDKTGINSMMYSVMNSLQRYMTLTGLQAKTLAGQIADPTAQIDKQIEAICIQLAIPVRVFKGSERGELASSQDDSQWNDRLRHRQQNYLTPKIIVPFIDRLITIGVLPKPKNGYRIEWPDLDSQTDAQKAQILLQKTQAYAAYVSGNVESILPPLDFMTKLDDLEADEAQTILDDAEEKKQEEQEQAQALADQHGFQPEPPEGFTHPPEPPEPQAPVKLKEGEKLVQPPQPPPPLTENYSPEQERDERGRFAGTDATERHIGEVRRLQVAERAGLRNAALGEKGAETATEKRAVAKLAIPETGLSLGYVSNPLTYSDAFKRLSKAEHAAIIKGIVSGRLHTREIYENGKDDYRLHKGSGDKPAENATTLRAASTVVGNLRFVEGDSATGLVLHGGAGSGNFGHAGRPGEVGGSGEGEGGQGSKQGGGAKGASSGEMHDAFRQWVEAYQKESAKERFGIGKEKGGEKHGEHGEGAKLGPELWEIFESWHEQWEALHDANVGGVLGSKLREKVEGVVLRIVPAVAKWERSKLNQMKERYGELGMAYLEVAASGMQMALHMAIGHGLSDMMEKGGEHLLHKMAHSLGHKAVGAAVESAAGTVSHLVPFTKLGLLIVEDAALRGLTLGHLTKDSAVAPTLKNLHRAIFYKTGLNKVGNAVAHGIGYVKSGVKHVVKGAGDALGEFTKGLTEAAIGLGTHNVLGRIFNAKANSATGKSPALTYEQIEALPDDAKLPGTDMTAGQLRKEVENLYMGLAEQVGQAMKEDPDLKDIANYPEAVSKLDSALDAMLKQRTDKRKS